MLDTHARKYVQPVIQRTADRLLKVGLSANQVTVLSFLIGTSSGVLVYFGLPWAAVIALWVSGYLDAVDGSMARATKPSPFGTVMDVTFDRIVEISVILGVAFLLPDILWAALLLMASIVVSMTIFLTVGNVSENNGVKSFRYQAGLAERTEGFIFLTALMIFQEYALWITLAFFAVEVFTAGQRFMEAKRLLS
ncbi:CDP-alcohol phosphatidyltransferase family protein [Jeotgalibacillus proteolyticus]|uniref:CDP-alcohol phosphatidyltransferase family protein n=1 Tax=Jeotgalibacillus proteolyticus TaxID=2082395 RepID=UPI003CFAE182